ncbi:MAG: hypothetical protein WAZ12_01035 [Candidatus Absconditicoccaceae bacterium]
MLNKLKKSGDKINSKFIQAVSITAMAIIILLKPGIAKGNENLDREISELSKKNPDKEIVIQENQDNNFNYTPNTVGGTPADTNQVKNLFLNMKSLTAVEKQEFLELRNAGKNNPNRDVMREEIQSIYEDFKDDNYRAIFIYAFLDPFQTSNLGQQAFQIINTDKYYKQYFKSLSRDYIASLELKKSTKELEQSTKELEQSTKELEQITKEVEKLEEVSKMLQQLIDVYKNYQKVFLFFV